MGTSLKEQKLQEELEKNEIYLPLLEYLMKQKKDNSKFFQTTEKIKRTRINTASVNGIFLQEYRKLMNSFHKEDIASILLKGLMLEPFYPAGVRNFSDIDLLVRKEDSENIERVLKNMGYEKLPEPRKGVVEIRKSESFLKKQRFPRILLEIHYRLGPCPYMDRPKPYRLFLDSKEMELGGFKARILCDEDLLIHLALHIFSHIPDTCIISICDMYQLIIQRKETIDWEKFLYKTEKYRLSKPLKFAFKRADEFFDFPLPDFVSSRLDAFEPGKKEKIVFQCLENSNKLLLNLAKILFGLRTLKKTQLALCILFPDIQFIKTNYRVRNPALIGIYYLKHLKEKIYYTAGWISSII